MGRKSLGALVCPESKRHRKILTATILAKRTMVRFMEIMVAGVSDYLNTLPIECLLDVDLAETKVIGSLVGEALANFTFGLNVSGNSSDPESIKRFTQLEAAVQFISK